MNTITRTALRRSAPIARTQLSARPIALQANFARAYATAGNPDVPSSGHTSNVPPRQASADPHDLSTAANMAQATAKVNRFAKRDPALYPLSAIVVGILAVAGYFFMSKATNTNGAQRSLQMHGLVNPWDSTDKHETHPSQVAEFKYRHKTREGHYEDSLPVLNQETIKLKDGAPTPKYHT